MSSLSADRPLADPKDDLFGHAAFAKRLADSIQTASCPDGLVLALYGPWGSGKSTVLSFVLHYLKQRLPEEQPVVVTFNPWWFSGQESLTRTFLDQLQAILPKTSEKFRKVGEMLGEFTAGIGNLLDLTGVTGGAGHPTGEMLSKLSKRNPKDLPALKDNINKLLREADKRILVVVDDIDRLTPEETKQLFAVIKGLADFPNMIYLLAFDREVAAQAIDRTGMPGDRYLEKIIQVPFELPPVDVTALRAALVHSLNEIITDTPDGLLDQSYLLNVYYDGLDTLFNVPRDVVRFINTLSVTYPSVRGEVNAVDFIALEALRVFTPTLYNTIRANIELFTAHGSSDESRKNRESILNAVIKDLPLRFRAKALELLPRLFPRLGTATYGAEWLSTWRKTLRVCHPELADIYFRFSVPPSLVRRSEIERVMQMATSPATLEQTFIDAAHQTRPDGLSKARALLERLMDHVEDDIRCEHVPVFINILFSVGDKLLNEADKQGMYAFGNESRIRRLVYHLLKRVALQDRSHILKMAIEDGEALYVQSYFLVGLVDMAGKQASADSLIEPSDLEITKRVWVEKVRGYKSQLLCNQELHFLLRCWHNWGDRDEVRAWCKEAIISDEGLLQFLRQFTTFSLSNRVGDWAVKKHIRLNPKWVQDFLDTTTIASRLKALQETGQIPVAASEYVDRFLKEFELIKEGKDPDSPWADE